MVQEWIYGENSECQKQDKRVVTSVPSKHGIILGMILYFSQVERKEMSLLEINYCKCLLLFVHMPLW